MNKEIVFKKDGSEDIIVKKNYAGYIWTNYIPFIGWILFLILTIMKKEFKAVWLNRFLLEITGGFVAGIVLGIIGGDALDVTVIYIVSYAITIIIDILLAQSINYTKAYQLYLYGYEPVIIDRTDEAFIEKSMVRKKPWYQWIAFK